MLHKAVVTGLGAVTPLGNNLEDTWQHLLEGRSGITHLKNLDTSKIGVTIGGEVKDLDTQEIPRGDMNRLDQHAVYATIAGFEAMRNAEAFNEEGNHPFDEWRMGVSLGTSAGPVGMFQKATRTFDSEGPRRVPLGAVVYGGADSGAAYLAMRLKARGTSLGIGATCASGVVAIGEAMRAIRHGYLDAVLVVGAEDCLNEVNLSANVNIRALATGYDSDPAAASRPFAADRAGFVMSQGAAAILLESEGIAKARGAKILAEIKGYGSTSDAFHATAPDPTGAGAERAMRDALQDAGLGANEISHANLHGTATPRGDAAEFLALSRIFGDKIPPAVALKSSFGHMLGAAGVLETAVGVKSIEEGLIPPTINTETLEFDLKFVESNPLTMGVQNVIKNSFGFGGHNASVVIGRPYT